jgi:hypothetical protein
LERIKKHFPPRFPDRPEKYLLYANRFPRWKRVTGSTEKVRLWKLLIATQENMIFAHIQMFDECMERLTAKGDFRENFPLPIIREMMDGNLRARPTARTVIERFQLSNPGLSFSGACCMHRDSDSIFGT